MLSVPLWGITLTLCSRLRRYQLRWTQKVARLALRIIGVNVMVNGHYPAMRELRHAPLIVANHLSYLDAIVIATEWPAVFVTSVEFEETWGLGWLCRAAGCVFVERRRRFAIQQDIHQLARTLMEGYPVVFFPEGTTSNGDGILPLKTPLFAAAIQSRAPILTVCLNYREKSGRPWPRAQGDDVAWYGEMRFLPHLWRMLQLPAWTIEMSYLPQQDFRQHRCRKRLAQDVKELWRQYFIPFRRED